MCSQAFSEQIEFCDELLKGNIIECNKYKSYDKHSILQIIKDFFQEEIMDNKTHSVITIGWSSDNPRICLNKHD